MWQKNIPIPTLDFLQENDMTSHIKTIGAMTSAALMIALQTACATITPSPAPAPVPVAQATVPAATPAPAPAPAASADVFTILSYASGQKLSTTKQEPLKVEYSEKKGDVTVQSVEVNWARSEVLAMLAWA
jgi:hypothetical protein